VGVKDFLKLRLYAPSSDSMAEKHILKRQPKMTLKKMLAHVQGQEAVLFYEISEYSITEFDTKQCVHVIWLDSHLKEHPHTLLMLKNSTILEVKIALLEKLKMDPERSCRVYEVSQNKIFQAHSDTTSIGSLKTDIGQLFVEVSILIFILGCA
jgi:hypothetical protein